MFSDDSDSDSPEKCRERRRRRIEKRRLKAGAGAGRFPSLSPNREATWPDIPDSFGDKKGYVHVTDEGSGTLMPLRLPGVGASLEKALVDNPMPNYGSISVPGHSGGMDDRILVKPDFCRTDIIDRQPLHFFAVYDGHGGPHVSTLCRDLLHLFIEQELMRAGGNARAGLSITGSSLTQKSQEKLYEEEWEEKLRGAIERSFHKMDQLALSTCTCGKVGYKCGCQPMDLAFAGSTAVVAILAPGHVLVANCGDSRAVLCRGGRPIPLSIDHKADRPDEQTRIHTAGGQLGFCDGAPIRGILNMSRSLGDNFLRSVVTSEPEISITERDPKDECLILASDGLWDVLSEAMACEVACTCLQDGSPATAPRNRNSRSSIKEEQPEVLFPSRSALAAAVLCRLALARGSYDDISVIVVDLKKH